MSRKCETTYVEQHNTVSLISEVSIPHKQMKNEHLITHFNRLDALSYGFSQY